MSKISLIKGLDRRNSVNSKSCWLPVGLSTDFSPHPVKYQGVREMNIYGTAEGLAMVNNFFIHNEQPDASGKNNYLGTFI